MTRQYGDARQPPPGRGEAVAAIRRPWAGDLRHFTTRAGHFMAEEAPEDIATLILDLMKR
ncbi:hypothetical protein [Streptomyces spiralis]|uniref:hypothetical protein n=1 Tax=Streptomyces spiralis TaxID=66376 RepID=UPI0036AD35F5